jgi:hypothetical protein
MTGFRKKARILAKGPVPFEDFDIVPISIVTVDHLAPLALSRTVDDDDAPSREPPSDDVSRCSHRSSSFSRVGASGKLRAVHRLLLHI